MPVGSKHLQSHFLIGIGYCNKYFYRIIRNAADAYKLVLFHIFANRVLLPDQTYLGEAEARSLRLYFMIPDKEMVVLFLGKDGTEKLRSRDLLTAHRLLLTIDAMPLRQQELKEKEKQQP